MSLLNKDSIFEGLSQYSATAPSEIRPIYDRCLVRDIPDSEMVGSVVIPQSLLNNGSGLRLGIIVAVGNGDRWIEKGWNNAAQEARRAAITVCQCGHHEKIHSVHGTHGKRACLMVDGQGEEFDYCPCKNFSPRLPMDVAPGDKVVYDRRKECEIYIHGERYSLIHQEQSIMAVIE